MKRTVTIIMVLCAIGINGCNKQSQQNPVSIITNYGNNNPTTIQAEGDKTDVKVDTNAVISPNNNNSNSGEPAPVPLPFTGWTPWDGIIISKDASSNERILNSNGRLPDAAGIVNAKLPTALRGKTIVLYFSNTKESSFSEGLMVKVECDNSVMQPSANASTVRNFLPAEDTPLDKGIEFTIPNTFNGKLNFVFYQADLKNLKITAYYK